jgi:murein DD-endopeptidase MepM/ murein hydrolase activator NlpD
VKTGSSIKTKLNYKTKATSEYIVKEIANISNNAIDRNDSKDNINSTIYAKDITESIYRGINKGVSLKKASIKPIRVASGIASRSLDNMQNKDLGTGINSAVYMANKTRKTIKIVSKIKKMIGTLTTILSNPLGLKVSLVTVSIVFFVLLLIILIFSISNYTQILYGDFYTNLFDINSVGGTGIFDWPVPSSKNITSNYGMRTHPISGKEEYHEGIDIAAEKEANIVAADSGKVSLVKNHISYGNYLTIDHGNGNKTLYAHCNSIIVTEGQNVQKGEIIAKVGRTGSATGDHLHFEVEINGKKVDPLSSLGNLN